MHPKLLINQHCNDETISAVTCFVQTAGKEKLPYLYPEKNNRMFGMWPKCLEVGAFNLAKNVSKVASSKLDMGKRYKHK